jgi:hypothetical protein
MEPVARRHWYHILMKLFCALALLGGSLMAAVNPQLKQVTKVYILSMTGGMDQYLANNLTKMGVFQVVTDPLSADAIITDRLGEPFENKFKDLYPPPEVVVPQDEKKDKDKKDKDKNDMTGGQQFRVTSFGKGKGTIFIVDRNTRNVVWSTYAPPKDTSSGELSKTAERVVRRLKDDLTDKKN